jgi:hypothetical protein
MYKEKQFIFITFEGITFQPNSESDTPDIENMQVIGFSNGLNKQDAFNNLLKKSSYLKDTTFSEIIGLELKDNKFDYFNISG